MITETEMYWITRLDCLHEFCGGLAIASFITSICLLMILVAEVCNAMQPVMKKPFYAAITVMVISAIVTILTPTTKEIVAIKVIPAIVNSKTLGEDVPSYIKRFCEAYLKQYEEVRK